MENVDAERGAVRSIAWLDLSNYDNVFSPFDVM